MSFEGAPAYRWVKMYKGVRYRVTCEELGAMVWTKEASGKLANQWWAKKHEELTRLDTASRILEQVPSAADLKEIIERGIAARAILQAGPLPPPGQPASRETVEDIVGIGPVDDEQRRAELLGRIVEKVAPAKVVTERTFGHHAQQFLKIARANVMPLSFREIRLYVDSLCEQHGTVDVANVNESFVEKVYLGLRDANLEPPTRKKRWGFFQRLVRYFWSNRLIELPRNLDTLRFKVTPKSVKVYDLAVVRELLGSLKPRLRCYALLGLNAGMTSADMGHLTKAQVDLDAGRLVRKRVKTAAVENVPTVEYALWPETVEALKAEWSADAVLVLTSADGTPMYSSRYEGGRTPQKDLITQQWKRARLRIPLKAFRSIAATVLESHHHYGRYKSHFLGHTPKTVADKNYAAPSQELFDEIMTWLRSELFCRQA
jgi:integrase